MSAAPNIVVDVHGLTKSFDGRVVVRDLSLQVKRGAIYGFLGPERFRQDHDHPHAVRLAHARRRHRHVPWLRHPHRNSEDQTPDWLHDPALQPVSGSVGA